MVDRRLGRGLDFFLSRGGGGQPEETTKHEDVGSGGERVLQLELSSLKPNPHQPRREFDEKELEQLAASIRQSGVLQPILVRQVDGEHQIVAGERRWRASKLAGLERIPALVQDLDENQIAVLGLVENLQRADLNALEKAHAFAEIQKITGYAQDEVARQVGLERSTVANFVRLLALPDEVQQHVASGRLTMGHARALLGLDADQILEAAQDCIRAGLNVRQVEELVRAVKSKAPQNPKLDDSGKPQPRKPKKEIWVREIEETLGSVLDAQVQVRYGRRRSKITIEIEGRDEFERVYSLLKQARRGD